MGHVVVNISLKGERGEQALTEVLVDTGATYTLLSPEVVKQVGAWKIAPYTLEVGLGDGRSGPLPSVSVRSEATKQSLRPSVLLY